MPIIPPEDIDEHDVLTVSSVLKPLSDTLKIGDKVTIIHIYIGMMTQKPIGFEMEYTNEDGNQDTITGNCELISFKL